MTPAKGSGVVREWLGWCPHARAVVRPGRRDHGAAPDYGMASVPGPSGADSTADRWNITYEHTQRAAVIIVSAAAVIAVLLFMMFLFGPELFVVFVLGIMAMMLAVCSTLTVSVDAAVLRIRFGPVGLIRRSWPLAEIVSVVKVTNPWYYGYGLRFTPSGPLYNVSGPDAVEIRLASGNAVRIGTDEPEVLRKAIEDARRKAVPVREFSS